MARIRSLKPEFWADRKLARAASRDARLLYIGMWNFADEHARLRADPAYLRGAILPYDDLTLDEIDAFVDELEACGRLTRYAADDELYLHIPTLPKHQRLEAVKVPSRLPEPPAQIGTNESVPRADPHARNTESGPDSSSSQVSASAQIGTNESAPIVVQQVAGSRLQEAGSKGQVAGSRSGGASRQTVTSDATPVENDPPTTCSLHVNVENPGPCGGCKTAREHHAKWTAKRNGEKASTAAKATAADRRAEINRCHLCDQDGYVGTKVCQHNPTALAAANAGIAALRGAIA